MVAGYGGPWRFMGLGKFESAGFRGVLYHANHEGYLTDAAQWRGMNRLLRDAQRRGMEVCIYDEDGFPSGGADGGQMHRLEPYPTTVRGHWVLSPPDI